MLVSRYTTYLLVLLSALFIWLGFTYNPHFYWPLLAVLPLALLGVWDMVQTRHSILRNYPIFGHLRFLFEQARPEFRQYFFESETSGRPFNREQRSLVYERAKDTIDKMPFGTQLDVYSENYAWLNHSTVPKPKAEKPFRIIIGGPQCSKPYSASVYNISAMSFGAISANAIRALNKGAKLGNFAHDTGEGSPARTGVISFGSLAPAISGVATTMVHLIPICSPIRQRTIRSKWSRSSCRKERNPAMVVYCLVRK